MTIMISQSCMNCYISKNKKIGNDIIERIEVFREQNDSLPNSLEEMGQNSIINDVYFCYWEIDSCNYMLWFGTYLGEGIYYYSDSKQWKDR